MKKVQLLLALLFISFSFTSCDSNEGSGSSSQNDDTFAENFGNVVSKDFIGQVVDTDNHAIQNATIKIGSSTVQTDVNGVFIINGASVHEKFAYITATKAGYLDGSRAMVPTSGKNNVKIMLVPNAPLETIQSGVVSEVSIYSGTKVKFDGAFQDEEGNAYSGTVQVSMFHLMPSDENLNSLMPGMLYAQDRNNDEVALETFGMLNVELRGSGGQKLNIKEGHTAEITMRIDDAQLATAPNSIPLWHFDEEKGYWKEDGVATKSGNKYVGEVSHFSWWNCDVQFPTVTLTTTVVDADGNALSNLIVALLPNNSSFPRTGITDTNGQVSGLVPANSSLTLTILNSCGETIHTATIGPFANDTVLPNIVVSGTNHLTLLQGTFLKCDNTNVTNGYVIMHYNSRDIVSNVSNGTFSFRTSICPGNTAFSLEGFDFDNLQSTGNVGFTAVEPLTNVGTLTACNTIDTFISYQLDGGPVNYIANSFSASVIQGTQFSINHLNNGEFVFIRGNAITPGTYTASNGFSFYSNLTGEINPTASALQYTITNFGAVNEYIDMTISGTYTSTGPVGQGPGTHSLTATVHVRRY